jgi:hypothetical protein
MTMLRNTLALVIGLVIGSVVNMALVMLGPSLFPPPAGVDMSSTESIAATIHLFEFRHFVFPWLAHAMGTLTGALTAFLVAGSYRVVLAWIIGFMSLVGGIFASIMIPAPLWFIATDLALAYLPMAWLAAAIGRRLLPGHPA